MTNEDYIVHSAGVYAGFARGGGGVQLFFEFGRAACRKAACGACRSYALGGGEALEVFIYLKYGSI